MQPITNSLVGEIHLIASCTALISGTLVLALTKGTKRHKQIGYVYVASMLVMLATAFMIYRLFGGFGIFHVFAIISLITLISGMYPILSRKNKNYLSLHLNQMYWSVMGLYCAFCAEIFTRIPFIFDLPNKRLLFALLTFLSIVLVMTIAVIVFRKSMVKWKDGSEF